MPATLDQNQFRTDQSKKKYHEGKKSGFVDSGFVKTCDELVIDLEDEDPVQGEAYINRAAQLQTQTKDSRLQILYKVKNDFNCLKFESSAFTFDFNPSKA